jgi:hypothetical protein
VAAALPWFKPSEVIALAPKQPDYVVEGIAYKGAVTEIDAKIKVGKTTLLAYIIRACRRAMPIFGLPTKPACFVIMTEEGIETTREWLDEVGLGDADDIIRIISFRDPTVQRVITELTWADVVALVALQAREWGADVMIVDTLSKWARIPGDQENSAGIAAAAMTPLEIVAAGEPKLSVWAVRHDRKAGGDVGDSGRGSSAFGGSADIILQLRRANTAGHPNRRVLAGVRRYRDVPAELTIELVDGEYIAIGNTLQVERAETKVKLLDRLPGADATPWLEAEILSQIPGLSRSTVRRALTDLFTDGLVDKVPAQGKTKTATGWRLKPTVQLRDDPGQISFQPAEAGPNGHVPNRNVPAPSGPSSGRQATELPKLTDQPPSPIGQLATEPASPCPACGEPMAKGLVCHPLCVPKFERRTRQATEEAP